MVVWGRSGPAGSWEGTEASGVPGGAPQHCRVWGEAVPTGLGHRMGVLDPFLIGSPEHKVNVES